MYGDGDGDGDGGVGGGLPSWPAALLLLLLVALHGGHRQGHCVCSCHAACAAPLLLSLLHQVLLHGGHCQGHRAVIGGGGEGGRVVWHEQR